MSELVVIREMQEKDILALDTNLSNKVGQVAKRF